MAKDVDVLEDMRDQLIKELKQLGLNPQASQTIAYNMQDHFRKHWGGQNIYFVKRIDLTDRDIEIFEAHKGDNTDELARKYNLSEQRIYSIIKRVRVQYIAARQIDLF